MFKYKSAYVSLGICMSSDLQTDLS